MAPRAREEDQPSLDDIIRLVPGLGARLRGGACVLELGCGAGWLTCALAAAYPASRCTGRDPGGADIRGARRRARVQRLPNARFVRGPALPARSTRAYDVVVTLDERVLAPAAVVARLGRIMAPGACALLAVPATTGSPADDALHPFGAYLLGARALSPAPVAPPSSELGRRLATAGFRVDAVARLPDDAFRNFLIIEKQTNPTPPTPRTGERS
jgi:SAM-dependent methyltransferase